MKQSSTARAERRADGKLPATRGRSAEYEVRDIGACHEQDESHGPEQEQQRALERTRRFLTEWPSHEGDRGIRVPGWRVALVDASRQDLELGTRFFDRRARLQPSDNAVNELVASYLQLPVGKRHGDPGGGGCRVESTATQREAERGRHHADNRVRPAIERDRAADDRSVGSKSRLPQTVAEHGHVHARPVLLLRERASQHRADPEYVEQIPRDPGDVEPHGRTTPRQFGRTWSVGRDPVERLLLTLDVDEVRRRERGVSGTARYRLCERHQAPGLIEWQRPEQHGVDDAERRRVDADAKAERQDDNGQESRMVTERPCGVPKVVEESSHARLTGCRRGTLPLFVVSRMSQLPKSSSAASHLASRDYLTGHSIFQASTRLNRIEAPVTRTGNGASWEID